MELNKQKLQELNGYMTSFMADLDFEDVFVSPDQKYIAIVSEIQIIVKSKIKTLLKRVDAIKQCIFSPNSQYMVLVSYKCHLFLYKCGEDKFEFIFQKINYIKQYSVSFSPDSKNIFVIGIIENNSEDVNFIITNYDTKLKLILLIQPIECIDLSRSLPQRAFGFEICLTEDVNDYYQINVKITRRNRGTLSFKSIKKIKIPNLSNYELNFMNLMFIQDTSQLRMYEPRTGKLIRSIERNQPSRQYHVISDQINKQIHEYKIINSNKEIKVKRNQLFPSIQPLSDIDFKLNKKMLINQYKFENEYFAMFWKKRVDFYKI